MLPLARLLEKIPTTTVLCVGDIMLDTYVYGRVDRVSPEAPIPVLQIARQTTMLGGAGNVTANLAALGATIRIVSVVGDDAAGKRLQSHLADLGMAEGVFVFTDTGRQTSVKTRYIAGQQQLLRADAETVAPVKPTTEDMLLEAAATLMPGVGALILSDYGKGVLSDPVTTRLITQANSHGVPVVVDPKGRHYERYRGALVVTPNRRELADASGMPTGTDGEVVAAGRTIAESCGIGAVVATRSEEGLSVIRADGDVLHLQAEAREVFDVSGAGDTVVATMAAALATRATLGDAAQLANLAAGIVVGKLGTATVSAAELLEAIHHAVWQKSESKVLTLESARAITATWRRKSERIGFANGCFDLLHPGHISLLTQAKSACDRLVVGLNSDESVRRLKGEQRPVQPETARATVLASLAMVDAVVIFPEDTPMRLIETLQPDVLVKGADYTLDRVVGADYVQSYGGQVLLADLMPGQSTTATLARLSGGDAKTTA